MSYKSPISVFFFDEYFKDKLSEDVDNLIHQAVLKVQIDVDKPRLLRALNYDSKQYDKGYSDGYFNGYATASEDIKNNIINFLKGEGYVKEETKQE